MTAFHWAFFAFLLLVLGALVLARRSGTRGDDDDQDKRFQCSVCGESYSEGELIEREFTSGYNHAICGACAAALYDEAVARDLIGAGAKKDTGA